MAYTQNINKNTSDSHQTSPAYVLTFTRSSVRDTVNYRVLDSNTTRGPLVVVNDAVAITVKYSKANPVPTFSCILKQGDLNYLTAISPGDYVVVNMVNWAEDAMKIRERALSGQSVNRKKDGFKGLFKILDVKMMLSVAPNGIKNYQVQVTARGFDEFNNTLYFNPAIAEDKSMKKGGVLFLSQFGDFSDLLVSKNTNNVQHLVEETIKRTIGVGLNLPLKEKTRLKQISAYRIPNQVAKLLNIKSAKHVCDINKHYIGIWKLNGKEQNYNSFFKPSYKGNKFKDPATSFFNTGKGEKDKLQGNRALSFDDFSNVKVWSLIKDYSNPILNESYTCYREGPDGHVYPSLVVRQKPFTTSHYNTFLKKASQEAVESKFIKIKTSDLPAPNTPFLNLPRWKVDGDLITSLSVGKSDLGRINFVQVFSRSLSVDAKFNQALQIESGNFYEDKNDTIKNGRKPYVVTCNYDYSGADSEFRARQWALLVADWVLNGHMKMNGTMETIGIQDPICVGDNLEFDDIVYHIENMSHSMTLNEKGGVSFRTNLSLSMGVSVKSSSTIPVYGEMDFTDTLTRREDDYNNERVLPGFSDTQDIPSRVKGEEVKETREASFTNPGSKNKGKKG